MSKSTSKDLSNPDSLRFIVLASTGEGYAEKVFENMFGDTLEFNETTAKHLTEHDVMFFDGGTDVDSEIYGETRSPFTESPNKARDERERRAFRRAQAVGAACIGVCRGSQFLTAMSGGKLLQHVTNHGNGAHKMYTQGGEMMQITSTHHQMMWPYRIPHDLLGWAEHESESHCQYGKDFFRHRQPEIVWYPQTRSLAIQGHPEYLIESARYYQYCRELVQKFIFKEKV